MPTFLKRLGVRLYRAARRPPARLPGALARLRELWQLHGLGSRIRALRKLDLGAGLGYDVLLFCPNYPDMSGARGNGGEFVRARVAAYARHGLAVLVVEVTRLNRAVVLEQQVGHACLRIAPLALNELLRCLAGHYRAVMVHAMTPQLATQLARHVAPERIAYFFHGAEIRDYRRLHFNYTTAEMEANRRARDSTHFARMAAARAVIRSARSPMVFVSHYLRDIAARDTGLALPLAQVIPNFIDTEFFAYRAKSVAMAGRVLLIRAFDGANYAADIAVAAILDLLATAPDVALQFTVCGFGRHFRSLTAPLAGYANVVLREGYLSRDEIRALHACHGIFLAPSRHDTQGVTMCEAMASGLVPVTHAVGGIPEYVDAECGELASDDTPREFARCIARLAADSGGFLRKSAAAAAHMQARCGAHATIVRELALIKQCAGPDTRPTARQVLCMSDIAVLANTADARLVTLTRGERSLAIAGAAIRFETALPALETCRYAFTNPREARAWLSVARVIGRRFAVGSVLLIRAGDALLPLVLMLKKHFEIDYVVWDLTPATASGARASAVLGCARAVVLAPGIELPSVEAKHVAPLRVLRSAAVSIDALLKAPAAALPAAVPAPLAHASNPQRVLLVAYYAGPCATVGVARPNYWFEELDRLSAGRTETHLATAVAPSETSLRIHHVPDLHGIALTEADDLRTKWVSEFVATEAQRTKQVNTLGYFWRVALERYFVDSQLHFDTVVISGNPFAYFDFAAFARARWGAKLVLDYRDPFALNPVMNYDAAARSTATFIEAGYNFQADLILAVNDECTARVVGYGEHATAVVANGYDERISADIVPRELERSRINLVHAGALNHYRRLDELLDALDDTHHRLHHVGRPPPAAPTTSASEVLVLHGIQTYRDTLAIVAGADCGIVFLSDAGFESTTKIFDYLCFDLDVLVISSDPTPRGPLAEIAAAGGKLHWLENTPAGLRHFLAGYAPSARRPGFGERYSRAASTRQLLALLDNFARPGSCDRSR